ncbi:aldo/keto reductase [Streptomyces niveus]
MSSLDSYITLGRSGLRVSPLGLGTMTFGEDHGWGASVETSEAVLTDSLERGGNLIDTANGYTNGHSEKNIGDYFSARPGLRPPAARPAPAPAARCGRCGTGPPPPPAAPATVPPGTAQLPATRPAAPGPPRCSPGTRTPPESPCEAA